MTTKKIINDLVKVKLNNNQIKALTSFIECRGVSAFKNSNLLKAINREDFERVPDELAKWVVDSGRLNPNLKSVRQHEIELFTK